MSNILIGKITSAQGLKGLVNIMSFAQNPTDIMQYEQLLDKNGEEFSKMEIVGGVKGKNKDVITVKIDGVNDRTQAEKMRNIELFIDESELDELEEGEFYYSDLVGLDVLDSKKTKIGIVKNADDYGAGGILEIEFEDKNKEMFSITNQIFPEVEIEQNYLVLNIPEIVEVKNQS